MSKANRFVINGADAASVSMASAARRAALALKVVTHARGGFVSRRQCGLPSLIDGHPHGGRLLGALPPAAPTSILSSAGHGSACTPRGYVASRRELRPELIMIALQERESCQ